MKWWLYTVIPGGGAGNVLATLSTWASRSQAQRIGQAVASQLNLRIVMVRARSRRDADRALDVAPVQGQAVMANPAHAHRTLVEAGYAQAARYHLLSGRGAPLADLYVGPEWSRKVAQLFTNFYGEPVQLVEHQGWRRSLADEPRVNPSVPLAVGQRRSIFPGGRVVTVLELKGSRAKVHDPDRGTRDWVDAHDLVSTSKALPARNPRGRFVYHLEDRGGAYLVIQSRESGRGKPVVIGSHRTLAEAERHLADLNATARRSTNPKGRKNPPAKRTIPPGKMLMAEYGSVAREDVATITVIAEGHSDRLNTTVRLVEVSPGWQPAGSAMTWTNGYFAVWWNDWSGTRYGQQYRELDKARAHFAKLVDVPNPSRSKRAREGRARLLAGTNRKASRAAASGRFVKAGAYARRSAYRRGRSAARGGSAPAWENPVGDAFKPGDRVELHAATDEWMQGDRYGVVVGLGRTREYTDRFSPGGIVKARPVRVKLDKSGRVRRFHPDNLFLMEQNPGRKTNPKRHPRNAKGAVFTIREAAADVLASDGFHALADEVMKGADIERALETAIPLARWKAHLGRALELARASRGRWDERVNPRARRPRLNPFGEPASEREQAEKFFRTWHEYDTTRTKRVRVPHTRMPKHVVQLGEVVRIDYISPKWEGKRVTYTHQTKRPYPLLVSSPDAAQLYLVGGKMKPTADGLVN